MSEHALSPDEAEPEEQDAEIQPPRRRGRGCLSRAGCGLFLIFWVVFLSIPTFMFILATEGEIAIWHGDRVPSSSEHPLLQVKLLMDAETRGLNITTSNISGVYDAGEVCVQTHVRYLLWQGEGEAADYCDCYQRVDADWVLSRTNTGGCSG
jgi:hypothetical protein